MDQNKKGSTRNGKLGIHDYEIPKKTFGLRIENHCGEFLGVGEAPFWASENFTGLVSFESHSPEWRVLLKFSFLEH